MGDGITTETTLRRGLERVERACCRVGNEGLSYDEAVEEVARGPEDVAAMFLALLGTGHVDDERVRGVLADALADYDGQS